MTSPQTLMLSINRIAAGGIVAATLLLPPAAFAATASSESGQVVIKSGEHLRGRRTAPVTLVMYADYECPFCQRIHPLMTEILREYRNKVSLIYRHYPLPFHDNALSAAEASECVQYLGGNLAFWGFTDTLFSLRRFEPLSYYSIAQKFGVDPERLSLCIDKRVFKSKVEAQQKSGDLAGVRGTPTVFIVNRKGRYQKTVEGAQDKSVYTAIIDEMLAEIEAAKLDGLKRQ